MGSQWDALHPYVRAAIGGLTGSTMLVGGALLAAMLVDLVDGRMTDWAALRTVITVMWVLGVVVVGVAYWSRSPSGREVWTDEQRQALRDLKAGKL